MSRSESFAALSTALLLLAAALGCARPPAGGEPFLARHLDQVPTERFRPQELIAIEPAPVVGGGCLLDEGWTVALPPGEYECAGPSLVLAPSQRRVVLTREVAFDAAEVDAFHAVIKGMSRQLVAIEWTRAGERFGAERRVESSVQVAAASGDGQARLAVRDHPEWRGRIAGLRLTLTIAPNRTARLVALTAVREVVDPRRLAEVAARAWQIDLDDETRGGVLGLPDRPWRWTTETRPGAELRFAYGRHGACEGAIRFEVRAVGEDDGTGDGEPDGERLAVRERGADRDREPLFARALPCDRDGWQEARVPLGDRAGPLTLEFATRAEGRLAVASGVPVWAGVELAGGRPRAGLNLVLVSIDTLRPDHLSLYGYPRPTTPRLEERSRRGAVVFERTVSAAPWTLPAHTSIFTGLDAERHGVNQHWGLPPSLSTLAEVLRAEGWATRAVTGGGFVHQQYGFAQGFDVYASFSERMGLANELDAGVRRAKAALADLRDRDFFLFFHTYVVHNPFLPRQPYLERLTGRATTTAVVNVEHQPAVAADGFRTRRTLIRTEGGRRVDAPAEEVQALGIDLYDSGIAYADERLADLWAAIDDLGLAERTLIVVTSDHGELFGEHGQVNHYSLYDENVMVPLVVLDPALGPGLRRVASQVRSIDLLPTLLERLGVAPPEGIDGRSFAPLLAGAGADRPTGDAWSYASASNYGIAVRRPDGTAYIARTDAWAAPGRREELFDGAGPSGGGEPNGSGDPAAFRAAAERRLRGLLAGLRIRCRNPGAEPYALTVLEAPSISSRVKLDRIGDGLLAVAESGGGTLTVAPGDDLTLVVEGSTLATLHLVVDHPRWGRTTINVDPPTLEAARWGGWSGGAWRMTGVEPPDGGALAIWWQGKRAADGAGDEAPADEDLARRLRALGYLR